MKKVIVYSLTVIFFALSGCGKASDNGGIFARESGHNTYWVDPLHIGAKDFHSFFVKTVPETPERAAAFARRCAGCHGKDGSGKIGPNIRGIKAEFIKVCFNIVTYMKWLKNVLSEEEIQAIADFLAAPYDSSLSPPVEVNAETCKQCHSENLDGGIAGIACYACHNGPDGRVGHPAGWLSMKDDPVYFHGHYGKDFVISCTACHGTDLKGPKVPSCYGCHDGVSAPVLDAFP